MYTLNNNRANLTLAAPGAMGSLSNQSMISVDARGPRVLNVTSPTPDGTYAEGREIAITVAFDEDAVVSGTPLLELELDGENRNASYATGTNTPELTFLYTVQAGDATADLGYAGIYALTLPGDSTIRDNIGNNANRTLPAPDSLSNQSSVSVEAVAPRVQSVTSPTPDGAYAEGREIAISVAFDETVRVSGTPLLELELDGENRNASYATGHNTMALTFLYTVQAGDAIADLGYAGPDALTLPGGANITDPAGNMANRTLPVPDSLSGQSDIAVDTRDPRVQSVTSPTPDGAYAEGREIAISVAFDETVRVSGTPLLELELDGENRLVDYDAGHNTTALTFLYTVQAGDSAADLGYAGPDALTLPGGANITDPAGNMANRTLPVPDSLSGQSDIAVDTRMPEVMSVTSPTLDGTYGEGREIAISVAFDEAVLVSGTPALELEMNGENRLVDYDAGHNTTALTFLYTVQAGDSAADLGYAGTGALTLPDGATIKDTAGNDANRTLPAPGSASSLGGSKDIAVMTSSGSSNGNGTGSQGNGTAPPPSPTPTDPCGGDAGCMLVDVGALLARGEPFDEQRWAAFSAAANRFNGMQDGQAERVLISLSRHNLTHGMAGAAVSAAHAGGAGPLYYLGPTFSGDVAGASGYIGANGLVAVSPSSSAASLGVPGDGIYRITPPVDREAGAMAGLIAGASVRTVVPAAQNGEFGSSTLETMTAAIAAAGINVTDPVRFDAANASSWRGALAGIDAALAAEPGAALLLVIGFEEDFAGMAAAAAAFDSARAARWFVPSGAIIPPLALEGDAAAVAQSARTTTLVFEDAAGGADARATVRAELAVAGMNATTYDYSASDAVFVLGGAIRLAAEGGANVSSADGAAAVRSNMLAAARGHSGALGDIRLDAAGDLRSPISYGVWTFGGDGEWSRLGAAAADDSFCSAAAAVAERGCTEMGVIVGTGSAADAAAAEAAMLAVDDYNSRLLEGGSSASAPPYIEARVLGINASGSSPARAAIASATGPAAYVGPSTDADLALLRAGAAEAGVLLFSPASTDPSLAASGDGVFRLAYDPTDAAEAALAAMERDGVGAAAFVAASGLGGGAGAESAAGRMSALAPSYGVQSAGIFEHAGGAAGAESAAEAAAAALAAAAAATPAAAAVVVTGASPADIEALAAAAMDDRPVLQSARWYVVDAAGHTAVRPAGPAMATLAAAATSVASLHVQYDAAAGGGAAGRIGHAVGYADAAPSLLYSSYDAAMLAAGALGTLPAGSAAGNATAAAEAAASVIPAAAAYVGILGDIALDAAGDLAPPASYALRAAPAAAGAGWAEAGSIAAPATCSMSIEREAIDLGEASAGGASAPARQTVSNGGTAPFALSVQASGWSAAGSQVLPASATEFRTGSEFAALPADGAAGPWQVAQGGSLAIDYRLNLAGQAASAAVSDIAPGTQLVQTVSYTAACPQ